MAIIKIIFKKMIIENYSPEDIIRILSDLDKEILLNLSSIIPRKRNIVATISRSGTLYNIFYNDGGNNQW